MILMKEKNDVLTSPEVQNKVEFSWGTPQPIPENEEILDLKDVQPFHPQMLPKALREYCYSAAYSLNNTAPDFLAVSLISSLSIVLGGNVEVQPKQNDNWSLNPIFFSMIVGYASDMKSPALMAAVRFLQQLQKNALEEDNKLKNILYASNKRRYEKEYKQLISELDAATEQEDDLLVMELAGRLSNLIEPEAPLARELVCNDTTMEAACQLLETNPSGVLCVRDELSGWFDSLRKNGREEERAFYLTAHDASNNEYKQNRVTRKNIVLKRLCMSVTGGIQPKMIRREVIEKLKGVKDDGLLERFLQMSVMPDIHNIEATDAKIDDDLIKAVMKLFELFSQFDNPFDPTTFMFSSEAQKRWDTWNKQAVEEQLSATESLQSFYGKRPAHCAKLALVFHLVDQATEQLHETSFKPNLRISKRALLQAISWSSYLELHVQRIMALSNTKIISYDSAKKLESKLRLLYPHFTAQDVAWAKWKDLKDKYERADAIQMLEKLGYIVEDQIPSKNDGRLVKGYRVHPCYID
ncbi:DUF3987 domain-containing protein [Vibrio crassostreae]|nr:DUF3987 domain-containing protein [Vibrio crassostreae]